MSDKNTLSSRTFMEKRSEAMKWWALLDPTTKTWFADKAYDAEWRDLTGRQVHALYYRLKEAKREDKRGASPEYCPECGSDVIDYKYDVDDYNKWYDKCPTCGWNNAIVNPDL